MTTVHILHNGVAICGAGIPRDWPEGHKWVRADSSPVATCTACRYVHGLSALEPAQPVVDDRADVLTLARSLCWVVEQVHQSHHMLARESWRDCRQGVCGSMEYMLGQVGLDKELKPTARRP